MAYFWEQGEWREVRGTFLLLQFSQTPSASHVQCTKVPYVGVASYEPHQECNVSAGDLASGLCLKVQGLVI